MLKLIAISSIAAIFFASPALADDTNQHFVPIDSPDLTAAICNAQAHNKKLAPLVAKESHTVEDLLEIHEITYTLENALMRIEKDLEKMKNDLEEIHLGSESMKADRISKFGAEYLSAVNLLLNGVECSKK
ncbi:DUF6746 family protein [Ningiella sp. W23]|uniref:DUF6746 family protein n=1 Tax=Ningiella sp. W23 TaxID=3023715 RepID=UPI003757E9E4